MVVRQILNVLGEYALVWSASTNLTEYSLASFFILTLVLALTRVASTKRVTGGASFKFAAKSSREYPLVKF